ncbi:MAG: Smr/MutS family protein [Pseudolabrys sp.]|nr:Smr/MutS family protein [Pseudolabrys sp.]
MSRDGRRRVLSYEERVLWTTITKAITPLRDAPAAAAVEPVHAELAKPRKAPPVFVKPAKAHKPAAPAKPAAPVKPAPAIEPLGRRMRRSLARGKEGIDARIDLHGLTQAQAHDALLRFLRTASARDARLVLVITGKGKRGDGDGERERGVLRRQVPQWLSQPEFRDVVIGFEDAHIAHGGEGALYVRVRRSRAI